MSSTLLVLASCGVWIFSEASLTTTIRIVSATPYLILFLRVTNYHWFKIAHWQLGRGIKKTTQGRVEQTYYMCSDKDHSERIQHKHGLQRLPCTPLPIWNCQAKVSLVRFDNISIIATSSIHSKSSHDIQVEVERFGVLVHEKPQAQIDDTKEDMPWHPACKSNAPLSFPSLDDYHSGLRDSETLRNSAWSSSQIYSPDEISRMIEELSRRSEHHQQHDLCNRCNKIPFYNIPSRHFGRTSGKILITLGIISPKDLMSPCAFCAFIAAVRFSARPQQPVPEDRIFVLYGFETQTSSKSFLPSLAIIPCPEQPVGYIAEQIELHPFVNPFLVQDNRPYIQEMIDIFGYVDVINASNEDVRNISECIIQRDTVNTGWIEIWLEQCRLKHKGTCAKKETICLPFLRLIDCETRVIKGPSSDETPKYLALSYVWGAMTTSQSSGGSRSIINGAKLGKLPPVGSLPKVIEDAISITKTLGHRYLWIDQYCIDQEDGDDIKVNLSSMHLIYGTASITLIAAAGKDQTFGLPGVGQRLRSFQPVTRIGKLGFISLGPAPKRWIDTSKYMTRGWTYQEGLFSRRKIFFTEYQVYVECRSAHCSEALVYLRSCWNTNSIESIFPDPCSDPLRLIEEYTQRSLSYDSDALNGLLGVLGMLKSLELPILHHWGIPAVLNSLWPRLDPSKTRRECNPVAGFIKGLSWFHTQTAMRREAFPSWSWAGWRGGIRYYSWNPTLQNLSDLPIFIETESGSLVDWNQYYNDYDKTRVEYNDSDLSPVLTIDVDTIDLYFIPKGESNHTSIHWYVNLPCLSGDLQSAPKHKFYPSIQLQEDRPFHSGEKNWTGILLDNDQLLSGNRVVPPILVVDLSEEVAIRVGIVLYYHSLPELTTRVNDYHIALSSSGGKDLVLSSEKNSHKYVTRRRIRLG